MHPRIKLGNWLIRAGAFIKSLAVVAMRPDDLIEFGRGTYSVPAIVDTYCRDDLIASGLYPDEEYFLRKIPHQAGRLLVLGLGGGREAIALARRNFAVTGIDFVPDLVKRAVANGERRGVRIDGQVQEISRLDLPENNFDVVWLSNYMYSFVPTRGRRIGLLKEIYHSLTAGGSLLCQFHWSANPVFSKADFFRKIMSYIFMGNIRYEKGDLLWCHSEFRHVFSDVRKLTAEIAQAGFAITEMKTSPESIGGWAILRKPPASAK